jgi:hypothetical protein
MNLQQRSDFYALLFEMWCASRRSKKIRNGLELCVEKLVSTIESYYMVDKKFWFQRRSMMLTILKKKIFTYEKICHHAVSIIALILIILIKIKIVHPFKISWAACFALATDALDNNPYLQCNTSLLSSFIV